MVSQIKEKNVFRGHIFSHVRPFYERAVSNLDRPMHRSLWVLVTHSSFTEGSHTTKNTASGDKQAGAGKTMYVVPASFRCRNCSIWQAILT